MHHRKLTYTASGTQKIDCWCIILTENQPLLHHANKDLTIAASCLLKTDHHSMILTENLPWPHYFSILVWWQPKIDHRCIIRAENLQKSFFLTENIGKFRLMVLEYSKKIVWSLVADFFLKLVYWQKIKAENFVTEIFLFDWKLIITALYMQKILLQKLFFLTENFWKYRPLRYGIGLEYSKKIVWSRVAEFFWKLVSWHKIKAKMKLSGCKPFS